MSDVSTNYLKHGFMQLGLTDEHAEVYFALLKLGKSSPSKVAKTAQIPRSSTYDYLQELEEWNFARKDDKSPKTLYIAENPIRIQEQLEYKRNRVNDVAYSLERNLHIFESIYSKNEQSGTTIQIFNGKKDMRTVLKEALKSSKIHIISALSIDNMAGIDLINDFFEEADVMNIEIELLTVDCENAQDFIEEHKYNPNLDIIVLPKSTFHYQEGVDKFLYDGIIAHFNYEKESCVVIKDESLLSMEKFQFMKTWESVRSEFGIL